MYHDVIDMRKFYTTSLGQVARRAIRHRIRELWGDTRGQVVCGIGYTSPYLRPFLDEARQTLAIMPAGLGCAPWPPEGPNMVALSDEAEIPLPDMSVDRLLMIHGIGLSDHMQPLMREAWRIMAGNGRLMVIVPNRLGIWAQIERTPFGHGSPYSPSQFKRILYEHLFQPERSSYALYVPPSQSRMLLKAARVWERIGHAWFQSLGGVYIVEASKQLTATATRSAPRKAPPAHRSSWYTP